MSSIPPRALMFDLDGTLVNTMSGFADLAASIMSHHHGADWATARTRYLETSGLPFRRQLEVIVPSHPGNERAAEEFERRKRNICRATPMDHETRGALATLRERGLGLIVSSNTGQDFVDEFTRREAFRFDLALGFDVRAGMAKGRPHVERALAELRLDRRELWFIGDSLKDGDLARECGIEFVGRIGTFMPSDFEDRFAGVRTIRAIGDLVEMTCRR